MRNGKPPNPRGAIKIRPWWKTRAGASPLLLRSRRPSRASSAVGSQRRGGAAARAPTPRARSRERLRTARRAANGRLTPWPGRARAMPASACSPLPELHRSVSRGSLRIRFGRLHLAVLPMEKCQTFVMRICFSNTNLTRSKISFCRFQ